MNAANQTVVENILYIIVLSFTDLIFFYMKKILLNSFKLFIIPQFIHFWAIHNIKISSNKVTTMDRCLSHNTV